MFDPGLMDMIMRLRSRGIFDTNVLRGFEKAPRKHFVSDVYWDKAYEDKSLPIACGQTISDPQSVAMMTQAMEAGSEDKLLEIGTGSGYHAAVMSVLVRRVYTVERYHQLVNEAEIRFRKLGINNIVTRHGDGRYGWKGQAPFDRIIITCGVKSVPNSLMAQLAPGGRLVAVIKGQLTVLTYDGVLPEEKALLPLELPPIETGKSQVL